MIKQHNITLAGYNAAQTGNTFATNCQPATFHAEELTPLNMSRKAKKVRRSNDMTQVKQPMFRYLFQKSKKMIDIGIVE